MPGNDDFNIASREVLFRRIGHELLTGKVIEAEGIYLINRMLKTQSRVWTKVLTEHGFGTPTFVPTNQFLDDLKRLATLFDD